MIVAEFNNGWGSVWPVKQFANEITHKLLSTSTEKLVIIDSTWYTQEYHQQVLAKLENINYDRIILVAMIDAAIPRADWYSRPVTGIGYYTDVPVDFWALVLDKFYQEPPVDLFDSQLIDTAYMCLNRKPHWHRMQLYNQLEQQGLLDHGLISMGGIRQLPQDVAGQALTPNAGPGEYGIGNDIVSLGHMDNWTRCLFNVVTETSWNINHFGFVSEKIYKPIVGCRPFVVYDTDSGLKWLQDRGFETYVDDFRDITDLALTDPNNIVPFLQVLCAQPKEYWQKKLLDLRDKLLYNKNHFAEYVQQQQEIINKGITCQI